MDGESRDLDRSAGHSVAAQEPPVHKALRLALRMALALVLIGTPALLLLRARQEAVDTMMRTALHQASIAMEAFGITRNTYVGATVNELEAHGYRRTPDVELSIEDVTIATYVLRACAEGGSEQSQRFESLTQTYKGEPIGCH